MDPPRAAGVDPPRAAGVYPPRAAGVELTGREFEAVAAHAGPAYLRYSFTKGTDQEVRFLLGAVGLRGGDRVLDVGCGPGRHSLALAREGIETVGLDISLRFLRDARYASASGSGATPPAAGWVRGDARSLPFASGRFDAAVSLCQGGFGLLGGTDDGLAVAEMARVVRPGGHVVMSAFSSYFAVRYLEESDAFDAATGVNHERTEVLSPEGDGRTFDLYTTCFTPRELRLMATQAGIQVEHLWAVSPGDYAARPPDLDHPEFLLIGAV